VVVFQHQSQAVVFVKNRVRSTGGRACRVIDIEQTGIRMFKQRCIV
jgi:hypothetical protein